MAFIHALRAFVIVFTNCFDTCVGFVWSIKGSLILEGITKHNFFCSSNTSWQRVILFIFTRRCKMLHFYILLFTTCKLLDFYPEIFDEMPPCHGVPSTILLESFQKLTMQRITQWGQFFLDFTEQNCIGSNILF